MEAEFKSIQRFVLHLWDFLKKSKLDILPECIGFNHFSVYFQQYKYLFMPIAFTITLRLIEIFKKKKNRVILL